MTHGRLRNGIGTATDLHGRLDYAKKFKLRFWVGYLDLPKRRNKRTSNGLRRTLMHRMTLW